ncbi:MAG: 2-hydroxyglutaryl-CoA dehydratase, partial [Bacteroidetes bacterium RIFCSPLOWO2_02_FULL_36_8]
ICSYLTSDIGSFLKKQTPLTKQYGLDSIPKPDLIVYNTNQCREVQDWFSFYAREFDCPIYGIVPPRYVGNITEEEVTDVVAQFKGMISVCENVTGKNFDIDRFRDTVRLSKLATMAWKDVLNTARHSPSPLSFFDGVIHMGPIVVLRGTQTAVDYYIKLLEELNTNQKKGSGILDKENCRVYWEGMPIWGKLRSLSELFLRNRTAVVASTYCNSWIFDDFDEKDPFKSTALAYTKIFINRSEQVKLEMMKTIIEDFNINGVIFHDSKTCFNNSNARFGLPLRLKEMCGVETLIVEGDLCDLHFFSEAQSTTKIETFIEQMT